MRDIALRVGRGEAVALLGPNGAGKTTVLKAIMGLVKQRRGSISIAGRDVSALPAHRVARGLAAIAPEGRRLFTDQTVEDNLMLGALHLRGDGAQVQALLRSVYDLFPVLYEYRRRLSSYLSGGEQQMVAIGRMLMSDPEVMLLDEPSVALSPVAVDIVVKALLKLRERGASLLLVEQRVDVAVRICDRLYIMTHGEIVDEMTPNDVRSERRVDHQQVSGLRAARVTGAAPRLAAFLVPCLSDFRGLTHALVPRSLTALQAGPSRSSNIYICDMFNSDQKQDRTSRPPPPRSRRRRSRRPGR